MQYFRAFVESFGAAPLSLLASPLPQDPIYQYASGEYPLTEESRARVFDYLQNQTLYTDDFGQIEQADFLLAFSFGDGESTNSKLASLVRDLTKQTSNLPLCLQQEIASHLADINHFTIADLDYQTTADVVARAKSKKLGFNVIVVAQAWHAKRCIETCQSLGLKVVALRGVNHFPFDDPQPWVRNPINWIIKESHRELATGDEISQKYQLL
ncbi:hypothetical protein [Vibrio rhodolitus]|uniref:hypothetical protein n=1 Tax=Vibrio rhodolitus TaxID=2231649 RepID=UPI000E0B6F3D|nr:hypothetical protein [Vibrio rhodolitus]